MSDRKSDTPICDEDMWNDGTGLLCVHYRMAQKLERELAAVTAERDALKKANNAIAEQRAEAIYTCADWDKAVSSLAAMVMRYFNSIKYRPTGNNDAANKLYNKCVKRGDDERELVKENAKLREEREKERAAVRELLAAIDEQVKYRGEIGEEITEAAQRVREVLG